MAFANESVDIGKKIKACREYDNKTKERRNYWAELSLWNDRTTGKLIVEAKKSGAIGHAHKPSHKNSSSVSLTELLGTETDNQAENLSRVSQKLAKPTDEEFTAAIEAVKESGEEVSRSSVRIALGGGAHVGKNSGDNEWYTPAGYINAALKTMGSIDLDPASSEIANETVGATKFFSEKQNGLTKKWDGSVYLNPPYSQPLINKFAEKIAAEFSSGNVTQACILVNNATETVWFQTMAAECSAICFPKSRIKFWHPDKISAPLQGQVVIYMGKRQEAFCNNFSQFGFVLVKS